MNNIRMITYSLTQLEAIVSASVSVTEVVLYYETYILLFF